MGIWYICRVAAIKLPFPVSILFNSLGLSPFLALSRSLSIPNNSKCAQTNMLYEHVQFLYSYSEASKYHNKCLSFYMRFVVFVCVYIWIERLRRRPAQWKLRAFCCYYCCLQEFNILVFTLCHSLPLIEHHPVFLFIFFVPIRANNFLFL